LALGVPQTKSLEVEKVAGQDSTGGEIILKEEGGKKSLYLGDKQPLDVTGWHDSLVEIEEKDEAKKADLVIKDGRFILQQGDLAVGLNFPIKIDPRQKKIMLETPFGDKFLAVMPYEAALVSLRAKAITQIDKSKPFDLVEEEKDLVYNISGERLLNILNIYELKVPVVAKVSASTGEVIWTNQPWWLRLAGFFLG